MATVAISGLPAATGVAGADVTPIVQSATTKKVTFSAIFAAPPAIGGTTPAAGAFTNISATGDITATWRNGAYLGWALDADYFQNIVNGATNREFLFQSSSNDTRADFVWKNSQSGVASLTERMRLSTTGLAVTGTVSATQSITAQGSTTLASGAGVEVIYSGGAGYVQSYNRTGAAYTVLNVSGSTTNIQASGSTIGAFSSTGLSVTGTVNINGTAASTTAGQVQFGSTTQSTIGANGAASALTANPLGYLVAYLGTTKIIIPYYNA